jgi:3-phenylpropionate/trans-cinnamate dioxygenase ferredoxin subunit
MKIKLGPADFAEKEMRGYEVGNLNVCIAKVNGRYKGLDDWCNHAGCLLSGGRVEDNLVICPCHEVGFDLDTGKNETSPGIADDQRVVKVEVENGQIVIDDPKGK